MKNQLVQKIKKLLEQLATTNANLFQEPYRSDLFKIFEEAIANGVPFDTSPDNMNADSLLDDLINAGLSVQNLNLGKLQSAWSEWIYCFKRGLTHGSDGKVFAYYVSVNDNDALAFVSQGYSAGTRISLSGLKVLNPGPFMLVPPQHKFPKNAPIKDCYWVGGVLYGI